MLPFWLNPPPLLTAHLCGFNGCSFEPRGLCAYSDLPKVIVVNYLVNFLDFWVCGFKGRSFAEPRVCRLFRHVRSLDPVRLFGGGV